MRKPNLFIVGAAKSGSTLLYSILEQHSDVFMSKVKEPAYLALGKDPKFIRNRNSKQWQTDFNSMSEYLSLFSSAKDEKLVGEASTCYLFHKNVSQDILSLNSESKVVIILRNPVERCISSFHHVVRDSEETELSILKAIKKEEEIYSRNDYALRWRYIEGGKYYEAVKHYLEVFEPNNIKVIIFEEFVNGINKGYRELCDFLDISHEEVNLRKKVNVSGVFNNKVYAWLYKIIKRGIITRGLLYKNRVTAKIVFNTLYYMENNLLTKEIVSDSIKNELYKIFESDIEKLEALLGKDLKIWKR